jgi:hypothetical protein
LNEFAIVLPCFVLTLLIRKQRILEFMNLKSGDNNRFVHTRNVMLYILHMFKFCFGIGTMAMIQLLLLIKYIVLVTCTMLRWICAEFSGFLSERLFN